MQNDPLTPPRSGRWLKIALVVSLALNVAVVGVFIGAAVKGHGPDGPRDLGFGPYGSALTDEDRQALRAAFRERGPELGSVRRAIREELNGALAALRAEPFDPAALQTVLDQGSARTVEFLRLGKELLAQHVAAMEPAERLAFADRLEEAMSRRMRPREDKDAAE